LKDRVLSARGTSVKDDWRAWLPEEKNQVFSAYVRQLELSYNIWSISLNEALGLRHCGKLAKASLAVCVTPDLCTRFATPLAALLWALSEHAKHYGTVPNAAPLDPANFQGSRSQRSARLNSLLCRVILSERMQFLYKVSVIGEMVEDLNEDFCWAASEIASAVAAVPESVWQAADAAHYDLNTCLREAIVLLKCFLRALPADELEAFQRTVRLQMGTVAPERAGLSQPHLRHRRVGQIAGE